MTGRVVPVGELPAHGTVSVDLPPPSSALAIGAHPDDVEFGCGATLAKWAAAGCRIHHLVLTDGSKGSWDAALDRHGDLVTTRRAEQREAARRLGGGHVDFLDFVDGELESGRAQMLEVCRALRRVRPAVVLGHDPWRRYRIHPDHRHAGWLVVDAVAAAREPRFDPDLGPAHRPEALLLWEADEPNHVEEVGGSVEAKVAALLAHESQYRSTFGIEDGGLASAPEVVRAFVEGQLADHGRLAGVDRGEAFRLITAL
jgi:LmbE family N-acetylglucosaminyl deacetylase